MTHMTLQDVSDESIAVLRPVKNDLANRAGFHGVRSVRMTVIQRLEVPALRVESKGQGMNNSVTTLREENDLDILSAFATQDGRVVQFFGRGDA